MAYSVSRRTREFGVRLALGCEHGDVLRMVLGQGLRTILVGVVTRDSGIAGADPDVGVDVIRRDRH